MSKRNTNLKRSAASRPTAERIASILPSEMTAAKRDIVAGLQDYKSAARTEDPGLALSQLPERCSVAIELLRKKTASPRRLFGLTVEFLLDWGTAALIDRQEIRSIQVSRDTVLESDDAEALKRFKWEYHVATDQRGARNRFAASVVKDVRDRVLALVGILGVDQRVVIIIALESVLMETACLPDSLKLQMADEVRQFLGGVRHRSTELAQVAAGVARAPVTDLQFSIHDM